ncbi:MAG: oligosaccharide flippase family protein [Candidatus Sulfotelmatobacter sp.]
MFRHLRQLAWETLVYGLSGIGTRFITVFLVPIYARIFTPADYGILSLVSTTMSLVAMFVVLALDNSAHRWFWDTEDTADRKRTLASWIWCQFVVATIFALVILASSRTMGKFILGNSDAGLYFQISAMALPLGVLNQVVTTWLRMQRRAWATTVFTLATTLINILFTVCLVIFLHQGVKGVFTSQVISVGVGSLAAALMMKDWVNPFHVRWNRLREMLRFSLPLIPGGLAFWIVSLSDRYFVDFYASVHEVGLYSVGSSVAAVIALGTAAFQQAWSPFALSIHKAPEAKRVYANAMLAYMWLTCALSAGLGLLAPEAIRLVATQKYLGAGSVVGLLALSYVMIGTTYIAALGPAIVKDSRPTGIAFILGAVLNIACNFLLVPYMGKEGAALATLISQATIAGYLFYRSQKLYPIPYRFGPALGLVGLSLGVMWLGRFVHFANPWSAVLAKVALASLFIPFLFMLRIMTLAQARRLVQVPAATG